jgi:predicted ATPase
LLLVIDNCEHVINSVASLAEAVLRMCPAASVLATSRELIRVEGEYVYRVAPLDVPTPDQEDPNIVFGHSAVQLFIAGAGALGVEFAPLGQTPLAIAAICQRLDGIPRAIEFAAARAAMLGPGQVLDHLDERFELLISGRRTALPRHQRLRATLDWSYDLLPDPERRLLRHLAVFVGGFTLEAATAVTGIEGQVASTTVEDIANLVAKSLVTLDGSALADRWRLLDTIRAYALEKVAESGEAEQVAHRHAAFFLDVAASESVIQDMVRYGREIDNIRAALDWAFLPDGDVSTGLALTVAVVPLWIQTSLMEECRQRIEQALGRLALRRPAICAARCNCSPR